MMTRELAKIWYRNECWSCEKEEIPLTVSVVLLKLSVEGVHLASEATGMMLRSKPPEGGEIRDDYLGTLLTLDNSTFSQSSTSMLQAFFSIYGSDGQFQGKYPIGEPR